MSYSIHATKADAEVVRDLHSKALGYPYPPPPAEPETLHAADVQCEPLGSRWFYELPEFSEDLPQTSQHLTEEERVQLAAMYASAVTEWPADWQHEPPPEEEE